MAKQKKQGSTPEEAKPSRAQGPDPDSVSFGNWLRQQREMREIGVREIADASKISVRYLEALEEDRFDLLPAAVFARGFLRQYARYVGLDADEVVNYYHAAREAQGPEDRPREAEFSVSSPDHSLPVGAILAAALVVAAILATIWFVFFRGKEAVSETASPVQNEAPAQQAPEITVSEPVSRAPSVQPPPDPAVGENQSPIRLTLDFRQDCWVEATVDGQRRVAEMRVQGESLTLDADASVELRLGNASGVDAQLNGSPYVLGDGSGRVTRVVVDLDAVRSLTEGSTTGGSSSSVGAVSWRLPASPGLAAPVRSGQTVSSSAVVVLPPSVVRENASAASSFD